MKRLVLVGDPFQKRPPAWPVEQGLVMVKQRGDHAIRGESLFDDGSGVAAHCGTEFRIDEQFDNGLGCSLVIL